MFGPDSVLGKLRVLGLGNLHDLLDRLVDLNSVAAVEQYLRDLREALDKLRGMAAKMGSQEDRQESELERLVRLQETRRTQAQFFATDADPGNDPHGVALLLAAQADDPRVEQLTQMHAATEAGAEQLAAAVKVVETRLDAMNARLVYLRSLKDQAEVQDEVTQAARAAGGIMGNGADGKVDKYVARAEDELAASTAHFKNALGSLAPDAKTDPAAASALAEFEMMKIKAASAAA